MNLFLFWLHIRPINDDSLWYKDANGVMQHISNKVDSYYVVGTTKNTIYGYVGSTPQSKVCGDSTVPEYSASIYGKYTARTLKVNCAHMNLVKNDDVISYVINRINEGHKPANDTSNPIIVPSVGPHPTPTPKN